MKGQKDNLIADPIALYNEKTVVPQYPKDGMTTEERIVGAIMGAFIGDALGVGRHWYYDYNRFWDNYGSWVTDYCDPQKDNPQNPMEKIAVYRYNSGVRAGFNSQTGQLIQVLLEHVTEKGQFISADYIDAVKGFFENEILPTASFSYENDPNEVNTYFGKGIKCFSGRYTNREVRENFDLWYNDGKKDGKWWQHPTVSVTSTSDGAQMAVILAALYRDPVELFNKCYEMLKMWYSDPAFISQALVYALTVQAIINGVELIDLDKYMVDILYKMDEVGKRISSHDDATFNANGLLIAAKPQVFTFDDRFAPLLFGANCHIYSLVQCSYYYAYKYCDDFEKAILVAANSCGNNMARGALTGALVGAMNGINAIPNRFIAGLSTEERLMPQEGQGAYLIHLARLAAEKTIGHKADFSADPDADCGCFI